MIDYQVIKFQIEQTICSVHNQHPEVILKGTEDKFSLACCCEDFQKTCLDEITELIANQAAQGILDVFNLD